MRNSHKPRVTAAVLAARQRNDAKTLDLALCAMRAYGQPLTVHGIAEEMRCAGRNAGQRAVSLGIRCGKIKCVGTILAPGENNRLYPYKIYLAV